MRVCGQCGKSGHNKRTCVDRPTAVVAEQKPATSPTPTGELDDETREAVEWYLGVLHPGGAPWKIASRRAASSEEDDN